MQFIFLSFTFLLFLIVLSLLFIMKNNAKTRFILGKIEMCGSREKDLDSLAECIHTTMQKVYPYLVDVGIYAKESYAYLRKSGTTINVNEDTLLKVDFEKKTPPKIPDRIYNTNVKKYGRYYLDYVEHNNMAIVFLSKTKTKLDKYKIALKLILQETELLSEISNYKNKLKLLDITRKSSEFFMAFTSNKEFIIAFLSSIAKNIVETPYMEISWEERVHKEGTFTQSLCRNFYVRGSGIIIKMCGKKLSKDEISKFGRMLDMISLIIMRKDVIENYLNILIDLVKISESKSEYYKNHSETVKNISTIIAENMELTNEQVNNIQYAALLHDIGMLEEISGVLIKKQKLTDDEYSRLKYHPVIGASIVYPINELYPISKPILQHHEFCDGSGYPYGISEEEFLLESRILSAAEILVGLTSKRPYRKNFSPDEALNIMETEFKEKISNDIIATLKRAYIDITDILEKGF